MAICSDSRSVILVFSVALIETSHFASVCFLFTEEKTSAYLLQREYNIYRF